MPEESVSSSLDLVPFKKERKIYVPSKEKGGGRILDLTSEREDVQVVERLPDGRILLRDAAATDPHKRFTIADPNNPLHQQVFRKPTSGEMLDLMASATGKFGEQLGFPSVTPGEKPSEYLLKSVPTMAQLAVSQFLPIPAPATVGTKLFQRALPHIARAGKVAGVGAATSVGSQLLREDKVSPTEVAAEALLLPAAELGFAGIGGTVRGLSRLYRGRVMPSKAALEAFWKQGILPSELKVGISEEAKGGSLRRPLEAAEKKAVQLSEKALSKFEAAGEGIDATAILDNVEQELEDAKETKHFFNRLHGPIYQTKGKVPYLTPKYPDIEAINREIKRENAVIIKQGNRINAGILKRNQKQLDALKDVKFFNPAQKQQAISQLPLEPTINPRAGIRLEETDESIYKKWREESEKLLSKASPRSLNNVRDILEKDAAKSTGPFDKKANASKRAIEVIDDILSQSTGHPDLEEAITWREFSKSIRDKQKMGGVARLLSKGSDVDIANAVNAGNPQDSLDYMRLLRSENATHVMTPKQINNGVKSIQLAWASSAVDDLGGTGRVNFLKISKNLGLTEEAEKAILSGDYNSSLIPKNVREIFSWNETGQGILRRLSFLDMVSGAQAKIGPLSRWTIPELVLAYWHPVYSMAAIGATNLKQIMGRYTVAKMLFSDVGTKELASWIALQNKLETQALMQRLKPGSTAFQKLRKQLALEMTARGASRWFEVGIAAKEAYRLAGQAEANKAQRPPEALPAQ